MGVKKKKSKNYLVPWTEMLIGPCALRGPQGFYQYYPRQKIPCDVELSLLVSVDTSVVEETPYVHMKMGSNSTEGGLLFFIYQT